MKSNSLSIFQPTGIATNSGKTRFLIALFLGVTLAAGAFGVDVDELDFEPVAAGLAAPVAITHAGDERLFITLQGGQVVILNSNDQVRPQPFLDISNRVGSGGERGLLSIAFHPNYRQNGFFFVNYTDRGGDTVIARYSVTDDRNRADESSEAVLLEIDQPFSNHNGGQMQFGPDGFLYVATGDGGSANDPNCAGQDTSTLLGKILRLDVDQNVDVPPFHGIPTGNPFIATSGARDEIWAYGLRNPWRFSFDRETGDLYIADVGQNAREEVDFQPAASTGGENYGWKMMEGFSCTNNTGGCGFAIPGCNAPEYTSPAFDYSHAGGRCSVTGGYVYRGSTVTEAAGAYFYGDFCSGEIWAAERQGNTWSSDLLPVRRFNLTSFGEDADGELYLVAGATLYRLTGPTTGGDCPLPPGNPRYCDECGPCGEGEGGCRGDDQCAADLACAENFGARFGLARTVDVCVTPRSLAPPPYRSGRLTVTGDLSEIRAVAINNVEEVVGHVDNGGVGADLSTAAFRGFPAQEVELLDPENASNSRGLGINDAGDVFGVLLNADRTGQTGVFLHRGGDFDFLERGATNRTRETFELEGLNNAGELAGSVARRLDNRRQPFLYTAEDGWLNLADLDRRFREASTRLVLLNETGDLVLNSIRPGTGDLAFFDTYLVRGNEIFTLGDFGVRLNQPLALNRAGRVVGIAGSATDRSGHAFVYSGRGGRLIDIHPPRFASSAGRAVTAKGIVGGTIASVDVPDTIFTWDNRRTRKMRIQARAVDFGLLLDESLNFVSIDGVRMNERLEFVGRIVARGNNPDIMTQRWFYYSPATGAVDVQDLATAAGLSETVLEVTDLNDWGSLLLRVENDAAEESVVVLTPLEN